MHAATTKNAADDGSPGTSSSNGVGRSGLDAHDGRRRSTRVRPAPRACARCDRGSRSARRSRSCPSACSPASTSARLHLRARDRGLVPPPRERAAAHDDGRKRAVRRASIDAPIARSGSTTRAIGRRRSDSSPSSTERNGRPASRPVSTRIVVPELAQSTTPSGSAQRVDARRRDGRGARRDPLIRDAEELEAASGRGDVGAGREVGDRAAPVGERGEQQRAVRDRLVARHPQPPAQRTARRRPRLVRQVAHASALRDDVVAELDESGFELVGAGGRGHEHEHTARPRPSARSRGRTTLTPSRPASVVTSASTPWRSGTGMRSSDELLDGRRADGQAAPRGARPFEHVEQTLRDRSRPRARGPRRARRGSRRAPATPRRGSR